MRRDPAAPDATMAKKKTERKTGKRIRRNDEQLIADLKERIKELRARQDAREIKRSPAIKAALAAVRFLDKALEAAALEGSSPLRHALADSRKPLADFLTSMGVRLPKARLPRGRRPNV